MHLEPKVGDTTRAWVEMPLEVHKALRQAELGFRKTKNWGKGARAFHYVLPPATSPDAYIFPSDESKLGAGPPMCARKVKALHAKARAVTAQLAPESGVQDQPAPSTGDNGDHRLFGLRMPGGASCEQYVFKNPSEYDEWHAFLQSEATPRLCPAMLVTRFPLFFRAGVAH